MLNEQLTTNFSNLFCGLKNKYGQITGYGPPKPNGKKNKLTVIKSGEPPINNHLSGSIQQIGTFPFVTNKTVKWGCIDVDEYKTKDLHHLLLEKLKKLGIDNGVVDRSSSGGCHIWFFFEKPVNAKKLRVKLEAIAKALGNYDTEIFPKQNEIDNPRYIGNFVYLPYYAGFDTPTMVAYRENGKYLSLEEFLEYAKDKTIKKLKDIKTVKPSKELVFDEKELEDPPIEFEDSSTDIAELLKDGPICLEDKYNSGEKESDHRNDTLFGYAVFSKRMKGMCSLEDIQHINSKLCEPPLSNTEVTRIVNSVNKQKYNMQIIHKKKPFEECNKQLCATRKNGVGGHSEYNNWLYIADKGKYVRLKPSKEIVNKQTAADSMWKATGDKRAIDNFMVRVGNNEVDTVEWHPGKKEIFQVPGVDGSVKTLFNLYQPPTIEAIEGDVTPFLDFMEDRFGSFQPGLKCLLDRVAWSVQFPGKKCNINILAYSKEQGTGKSILGVLMGHIHGMPNYSNVTMDDFLSGWGDTVMMKLWVDVEEAHSQGTDRRKLLSILNRYSTVKVATLNKKYGEFIQVELLAMLYLTTNFETAMSITDEDRRYLILRCDNDKPELKQQNYEEGNALGKWLEEEQGFEKVYHYLLNRDLSSFEPYAPVPRTPWKDEMIKHTYGPGIHKCLEAWEYRKWPFTSESDVCAPDVLADIFKVNKDTLILAMKKFMKVQNLCRVQKVSFEIKGDRNNSGQDQRVEGGMRDIHLYSWNNELICQKEVMKPREVLKEYLHPCVIGPLKTFAEGEVGDK